MQKTHSYAYNESLEKVLQLLEEKAELMLIWFKHNYVKLRESFKVKLLNDFFLYLFSRSEKKRDVKLLGININSDLKFDKYVLQICCNGGITRVSKFISFKKIKNHI